MSKKRPPHPPEFRHRMIELVRAGHSPEGLAKEFESSVSIGAQNCPPIGVHPYEWTGLGCEFDHLPGVLLFKLGGAPVA
jgi:hypothetical protein